MKSWKTYKRTEIKFGSLKNEAKKRNQDLCQEGVPGQAH